MPHTKSAKKRDRQNAKNRDRNRAMRTKVRTSIKKARSAAETAPREPAADAALRQATRDLDKAAQKGLIKKNEASRRKARLAKARDRAAATLKDAL